MYNVCVNKSVFLRHVQTILHPLNCLVVLSEVSISQVEAISCPGHGEVGDVLTPLVGALATAPLVVGEPQPPAHTLASVNPQGLLLHSSVFS